MATSTAAQNIFPFLLLPTELRNMVYKSYFESHKTQLILGQPLSRNPEATILAINTQINREATHFAYNLATFTVHEKVLQDLDNPSSINHTIKKCFEEQRKRVKNLRVIGKPVPTQFSSAKILHHFPSVQQVKVDVFIKADARCIGSPWIPKGHRHRFKASRHMSSELVRVCAYYSLLFDHREAWMWVMRGRKTEQRFRIEIRVVFDLHGKRVCSAVISTGGIESVNAWYGKAATWEKCLLEAIEDAGKFEER